jgi:UTP--glucose-1-phosphate uridylyltransferase
MVTGRNKRPLEDHFDNARELEDMLAARGDTEKLALVNHSSNLATVHYVRQGEPRGLGHAVSCAARHVGDNPFAVLLGDDLIDPRDPLLTTMIALRLARGGSVVALLEVPRDQIYLYGCAAVEPLEGSDDPDTVRITDLVEKPSVEDAPSSYAVIGRYVLDPAVFRVLEGTEPGRGGEIQLTDALRTLARDVDPGDGGGVTGVVFRGRRYDTGDRLSYLQAVVRLACEREDLGPDLVPWLKDFVATL